MRAQVARLLAAGVPAREIMVVSPYNVQVDALREALPAEVPVGTVDKFQGQEAQVVLYSMASSSGEDVPRGLEFLLSRNRLNVAISRARCLAYLVCSPRLLEVNCRSIPQMRLANALCRFVEVAEEQERWRPRPRRRAELRADFYGFGTKSLHSRDASSAAMKACTRSDVRPSRRSTHSPVRSAPAPTSGSPRRVPRHPS